MLKLTTYQKIFFSIISSIILLLLGFAILFISLFDANRQQAASIQEISPPTINLSSPFP